MSSSGSQTVRAHVQSIEPIAATVLYCRLATKELVAYEPGHYCMVAVGDTARAYSFATPAGTREIEWLINTAPGGPASLFFSAARSGTALTFTAPYGDFVLDRTDTRPLLYVAGGVGLAPIMAHLLALLAAKTSRPITLLVGHHSRQDMFWHKELAQLSAANRFFYRGVVGPFLDILPGIPNLLLHTVYICGSADMCTATAEALYKLGVSPAQVHYELFT